MIPQNNPLSVLGTSRFTDTDGLVLDVHQNSGSVTFTAEGSVTVPAGNQTLSESALSEMYAALPDLLKDVVRRGPGIYDRCTLHSHVEGEYPGYLICADSDLEHILNLIRCVEGIVFLLYHCADPSETAGRIRCAVNCEFLPALPGELMVQI